MKKMTIIMLMLVTGAAMTLHAQIALSPDKVPRMSIEELRQHIGDPNFAIVDVRASHDWDDSKVKIKGSIREDGSKVTNWMAKYPPTRTLVFYCA
jgi:hypothetical protein